jgi:hypothetical protein
MKRVHVPEEVSQEGRVRPVEYCTATLFVLCLIAIHLCNVIFVPNNCRLKILVE